MTKPIAHKDTSEARCKVERDSQIRKALRPEKKKKYVVTNAIAGAQTGRGVK